MGLNHPAEMRRQLLLSAILLLDAGHAMAVSARYQEAVKARIQGGYAVVVFSDGSRSLIPVSSIGPDDLAWLTQLSTRSPLAHGKSTIVVVKETDEVKAKKTIEISKTEGALETVQLCQPNVIQNQIGGTCMIYARIHWLDIAGYYVKRSDVYKIINDTPPDSPWQSAQYREGLHTIMTGFKSKPIVHNLAGTADDPLAWARDELRKGRPILAAFPHEVWQALPSGFVAAHPWNGGPVGHQVVINGFTWNKDTKQGTFHIINSWQELPQFDLTTENAKDGVLLIEQSLSPVGEAKAETVKEVVQSVRLIKAVGATNLYEVQTNLGTRRVAAEDEAAARATIEEGP
jgi:hypothetical protein